MKINEIKMKATAVALCLAVLVAATSPVQAQVFVTDSLGNKTAIAAKLGQAGEYGETASRYIRQVDEWKNQADRYTSMLSKLQSVTSMLNTINLPTGQKLEKVDESAGLASACNLKSGLSGLFSLQNLTKALGIGENSGLEEQKTICAMRVTMQNRKYNESVDFMNETMPSIQATMKKLMSTISGLGETPGAQDQHQTDTPAIDADTQKKIDEFQARQKQYEALISALDERQKLLAQQLMRGGSKSVLGEAVGVVVQSAALEAALHYNK